jgi:hypothetical protein
VERKFSILLASSARNSFIASGPGPCLLRYSLSPCEGTLARGATGPSVARLRSGELRTGSRCRTMFRKRKDRYHSSSCSGSRSKWQQDRPTKRDPRLALVQERAGAQGEERSGIAQRASCHEVSRYLSADYDVSRSCLSFCSLGCGGSTAIEDALFALPKNPMRDCSRRCLFRLLPGSFESSRLSDFPSRMRSRNFV